MRDFKFTESDRPTMANFNQRFQSIADLANGLGNEYVWLRNDGTYVNSPDPNAYPPAVSDGYTYTAFGQFGSKVRIETGSYVGTGTYGSSNPNSLTFDFAPKALIFLAAYNEKQGRLMGISSDSNYLSRVPCDALTKTYNAYGSNGYQYWKKSADGKTISWYSDNGYGYQHNSSNHTYYCLAIG